MKTSKARYSEWGFRDTLSKYELHSLKEAITEANRIALKVKDIPARSGGNHWTANTMLKKLSEELKNVYQTKIVDEKSLKDLISPTSPTALYYAGYSILSGRQIAPMLMLAEVDRAYGINVILNFSHGSHEAYRRFNPLVKLLLSDGSGARFIDATCLANINDIDPWQKYTLVENMADVVCHTHYLAEKNGYYHLSLTANAFGLSNTIKLLNLKIYADHLHYYRPRQRYSHFSNDTSHTGTDMEHAFDNVLATNAGHRSVPPEKARVFDCIPERLLALTELPAGIHRKIEQLVDNSLAGVLHTAIAKQREYGGALPLRTLGSAVAGCNNGGAQKALPACPPELLEIEGRASELWDEAAALLNIRRAGKTDKDRLFLPVDIADFESNSPQRRLLAAVECQKNWEAFVAGCSFSEMVYEKLMKEAPNCPMPYTADQPVGQRLKAAVSGQLMSDIGVGASAIYHVPNHVFAYQKDPSLGEERNKAVEAMHNTVGNMIHRLIAFHYLRDVSRMKIDGVFDSWLSFHEEHYRYAGCGVSSVEQLIFPAFFFSDRRFLEMIAEDEDWFREPWLKIRESLKDFGIYFGAKNWSRIYQIISKIFDEIKKLSLTLINGDGSLPANDLFAITQPPAVSPFSPPPAHFSKEQIAVPESLAPVQLVKAPPGSAARYEQFIARNASFIRKLRRIDSVFRKPCASFKRYARTGPIFDDLRLPFYQEGELLYSMVQYTHKIVPGQKSQVVILFDFSGSMGEDKVAKAKDVAVIMAEGLKERFDIRLYLYTTNGSFYELINIFDSGDKTAGKMGLASITANDTSHGRGWNPDAAMIMAVNSIMKGRPDKRRYCLIHISDCEFCKSLSRGDLANGLEEVELAVRRIVDEGNSYVVTRIGKDENPFALSNVRHEYLHFPDGVLKEAKVDELYKALLQATKDVF